MKLGKLPPCRSLLLLLVTLTSTALVHGTPVKPPEKVSPDECSKHIVKKLGNATDSCPGIRLIEGYVNLVRSTPHVGRSYDDYPMLQSFDDALTNASEHALLWDTGDSIHSGFYLTVLRTRQFQLDFTRRFGINLKRAEMLKEKEEDLDQMKKNQEEIAMLQKDISLQEKFRKMAVEMNNTMMYEMATKQIESLRNRTKQYEEDASNKPSLIKMIRELVKFLGYVKRDSDRVREVALKTKEKIERFKINLLTDQGNFNNLASDGKKTLEEIIIREYNNSVLLEEYLYNKSKAEADYESAKGKIDTLFNEMSKKRQDYKKEVHQLISDMHDSKKAGEWQWYYAFSRPQSYIKGKHDANKYADQLDHTINIHENDVEHTLKQIDLKKADKAEIRQEVERFTNYTNHIREEMTLFIFLNADLNDMKGRANDLVEAINKTLHGVDVIHRTFEDISFSLETMITTAAQAKNDTEMLEAQESITDDLMKLKCTWEIINDKVVSIDECQQELTTIANLTSPTTNATSPTTVEPQTNATSPTTVEPQTNATSPTTVEPQTNATSQTIAEPRTNTTSTTAESRTKATSPTAILLDVSLVKNPKHRSPPGTSASINTIRAPRNEASLEGSRVVGAQ